MTDVETRLDKIESKLDSIAETLKVVAVQHEQIANLQGQVSALWTKYDSICGPEGTISVVRNHQASCPRAQMKYLWAIVVPMALALLGVGFRMFA